MFQHMNTDDIRQVAASYEQAPVMDIRALDGWLTLGRVSIAWRDRIIAQGITVEYTDDEVPYASATEMFDDIAHNRRMVVTRANTTHPVWNEETNLAFRVWHDMCHYDTQGDFELGGELAACSHQAEQLWLTSGGQDPLGAHLALYTECIGQLAYRLDRGEFGPQKVAYLTHAN